MLVNQSCDVTVVGAGPAGSTLAYELARRGIGVLLLEKENLPRYKCCAGAVTSKAARLFDFDISEVAEDVVHEISFTFNLGSPCLRQYDQPLMYTVMRDVFDHLLAKRARQSGASLMDGQKVTRVQLSGDRVEISTADNVFRSRLVVGADGAHSIVARHLDMGKVIEYFMGIESEIVVGDEELAKWKSRVQIDLGCVPRGYAWVFPKREHLSVGMASLPSKTGHLNHYYHKFLNSLSVGNYAITKSSSHVVPTRTQGKVVWQDKALLLGDAAGLADPLTGEGIHNAVLSAHLAAPVIEDSLAHGKVRLEDYQEAVDNKIVAELRIARVVSKLFVRLPQLMFATLKRSDDVWRAGCGLVSGQLRYSDIKEQAGGFKGIFKRLLLA